MTKAEIIFGRVRDLEITILLSDK